MCMHLTMLWCAWEGFYSLIFHCLLRKWRQHKGAYSNASYYASRASAKCSKVTSKVHKIWRRQKHALVVFLGLLMSGDIELNPGPKEGKHQICNSYITGARDVWHLLH